MMKAPHVRPRVRRILLIVAIVGVVLVLFGFFGLPPIIRSQAQKRLSAELDRPVTIEKVRINPLVLAATIEGFAIADRDGGPFVSWQRFHANFDSFSLFTGDWRFSEIALHGFRGHVAVDTDGRLNFADILERPPAPDEDDADDKPRPLFIRQLVVSDAQVTFSDQSRTEPFESQLGPLEFTLDDFRTAGGDDAPYAFQARTEAGESLTWQGTVATEPLGSRGSFELRNITLPKYAPYYGDFVNFELLDGTLNVGGHYSVTLASGAPQLQWRDGSVAVNNLRIALPDTPDPLVQLTSFEISGVVAEMSDPARPTAQIARIIAQGLQVRALRDAGGINLLQALPSSTPDEPDAQPESSPAAAPAKTLPTVRIAELTLPDARIEWEDRTLPTPAQLIVEALAVSVRDIDLATPEVRVPVAVSARLASGGEMRVEGDVSLLPLAATLTTQIDELALVAGAPYAEALAPVRIVDGRLRVSGTTELADGTPRFRGDVAIKQLRTEGPAGVPLAGWDALEISGAQVTSSPMAAHVDLVRLVKPVAHVLINQDGQLNVSQLSGEKQPEQSAETPPPDAQPAPSPAPETAPQAPPPDLMVARVELVDAALQFEDQSISPPARMAVERFGGTITGLSSKPESRAELDLRGQATGGAPIRITGQLNPLSRPPFADVTVDFQNLDLSPAGPYVAKYAGYRLNGGTLTLDVDADLTNWQLNSRNVVTLEQFTLGEKSNSPDATTLPVQLGLSLLRDRSGRIVLEVPIQGRINEPSFSVGPVVSRVITNLLTKAATSPFSLLGAMFGGGGEELSFQVFQPGEVQSAPDQQQKLETVARALRERPGLRLEIRGAFDPASDREALQRSRLEQELATFAGAPVAATATDAEPSPDPARRLEALTALFEETFPSVAVTDAVDDGASEAEQGSVDAKGDESADPSLRRRFTRWVRRVFGRSNDAPGQAETPAPADDVATATPAAAGGPEQVQPTPEEMFRRLAERIPVTPDDLQQLAHSRADWVRSTLVDTGGIEPGRITVVAPAPEGARVNLGLK